MNMKCCSSYDLFSWRRAISARKFAISSRECTSGLQLCSHSWDDHWHTIWQIFLQATRASLETALFFCVADETKMEPRMLHECIRMLISYGFVDIVDIFLFTNEYCLTERFPMLYSDEQLQKVWNYYLMMMHPSSHILSWSISCGHEGNLLSMNLHFCSPTSIIWRSDSPCCTPTSSSRRYEHRSRRLNVVFEEHPDWFIKGYPSMLTLLCGINCYSQ